MEMGDELEDATLVSFLDTDSVNFGHNLSSYAKNKSANPIRLAISKRCVDGRHIKLKLKATCDNTDSITEQPIILEVENGVEIGGMLTKDMTLYPNVHYIVTSLLAIPAGVTLTIKPGTILKFKDNTGISTAIGGHIIAQGKPDSLIVFTKTDLGQGRKVTIASADTSIFSYCDFHSFYGNVFGCKGLTIDGEAISNCCFYDINSDNTIVRVQNISQCTFFNSTISSPLLDDYRLLSNSNICANRKAGNIIFITGGNLELLGGCGLIYRDYDQWNEKRVENNNVFGNRSLYKDYKDLVNCNFLSNASTPVIVDAPQYWGSNREDLISEGIWDLRKSVSYCYYDLSKRLSRPSPLAHGIVWKVVVNGYDAQDEFEQLPPLGVGRHKFEVYFNRAMDTLYTPTISMGVRSPYTQISIAEDGHWNADSTIYTAYLNLTGSMATDGLCRIYVTDAKDNEHFDIPTENTRFNVQVSAAGSMSAGFMAQAGLGKVYLEWNDQDANIADVLGYNMYRYMVDTLGHPLDTIRINHELIDDTLYTDFDVTPGTTYYYYYKVLRTDLQENSPSHTVAGTPLTASKGDANGSMTVDVADVVTEIAHLTNDNPQPFIFEAADVNSDSVINILDVVGTINIIIHPQTTSLGFSDNNTAVYTIEDGVLYVETPVVLGGVQFTLIGDRQTDSFQPLEALQGFEQVSNWTDDETYTFLAYSMSGKTLGIGKQALLRIGDATLEGIVLSNPRGQNVPAIQGSATAISVAEAMQMQSAYPNPFTTEVVIPYIIGQTGTHNVRFVFSNVAGLVVDTYSAQQTFGKYTYTWHPTALPAGVYFVMLYVDDKALQVAKLVCAAK